MNRPQPQPDDVLLGCIHAPDPYTSSHIFQIPKGLPFRRPDGTTATATWIVLCKKCHRRYVVQRGGLATDAPIACDYTWRKDNAPLPYKEPS